MADLISTTITFALSNFTLTFLVLGFLVALVAISRALKPVTGALIVEKLLAWHVFFAIGVAYFYNFVMHVFFGEMAAAFIGWENSPFQFEVGTASLGFAVVGFFAAFRGFDARFAAVTGPAMFSFGAAVGHIRDMLATANFAPGNTGVVLYTDILIPVIGFVLLFLQWRYDHTQAAPSRVLRSA
jgi:hypothetical protein